MWIFLPDSLLFSFLFSALGQFHGQDFEFFYFKMKKNNFLNSTFGLLK